MKLGTLCDIVRGSSPRPQGDSRYFGGPVPRLMLADVTRDGMYVTPKIDSLTEEGAAKSRPMNKGDVVIAVSGDPGRACILDIDACIHDGFVGLRNLNEEEIYKPYLLYYLSFFKNTTKKGAVGAIFQNLTTDQIKSIDIPEITLHDQTHIANILSKAESLISQRKESLRLLDELLKSTFLEMFGDPVRNEKRWNKSSIIEFANCIVPGRDKPKSFTGDLPWITTEDLVDMGFTTSSKKALGLSEAEINEVSARVIPTNSILVTCVGDLGILSINTKPMVVNQQLHTFQCRSDLNSVFAMYSLSFEKGFMYRTASTTTVPYMNKTICNSIPIIVPPIKLQTQFAHIVEKTEALKAHYQASLQELENLYGALSQRAFRGELNN